MKTKTSDLARILNSGRLVVTAECIPPKGSDASAIKNYSDNLPENLDAVVVADNPDAIRSSAISTATLLKKLGRNNVIMAMTTRDRNRIGLMSDALGAAALGISAILCVAGNHQSIEICPEAASANDLDSVQFIYALKDMILHGAGLGGNKLTLKPELLIGAVVQPYQRPIELNLLHMRKKISAGADFLFTQAVFDLDEFEVWMDAVREEGLEKRAAIIASVMPITSVSKARKYQKSGIYGPIPDTVINRIDKSPVLKEEGVLIASDIASKLKQVQGVHGIHILNAGSEQMASGVIERSGIGNAGLSGAV